ncbi:MAG: 2-C-methyl-D-erythritol 4-phosphate cytidylyltransferase [Lachnospiraceae bacterium]|nr:2-C-methyl-D-erythritol 4-phosphate cytidylyltransferase [Lachnospiraceae bacterium]
MKDGKRTAAVVLAGGSGKRMGGGIPKQYMDLAGRPLICHSLKAFEDSFVDDIVLVCGEDDRQYCSSEIVEKYGFSKVRCIASAGRERYHSVYNGMKALVCMWEGASAEPCDIVFIHDGARPFVNEEIIGRTFEAAVGFGAAAAAVPAKDTIKLANAAGFAVETVPRDIAWQMQTPQTFDFRRIYEAYSRLIESEEDIMKKGINVTDDTMVFELFSGRKVRLVMGDYRNIKITTPDDMAIARYITEG